MSFGKSGQRQAWYVLVDSRGLDELTVSCAVVYSALSVALILDVFKKTFS